MLPRPPSQRVVRNKAFRKVLRFYKITFGLKAPYKVRAHGVCRVCGGVFVWCVV